MAGVDVLGDELTGHRATAESRGGETGDDEEVGQGRDTADDGLAVERKRHEPGPRPAYREAAEKRQDLPGVALVLVDARGIRCGVEADRLAIATEDDLAVARLTAVEVAGDPRALSVGQLGRGVRVALWVAVPVEGRLRGRDDLEHARGHGVTGPHLAPHRDDRDVEAEHAP